jgi:hypothetical protein
MGIREDARFNFAGPIADYLLACPSFSATLFACVNSSR